MNILAYFVFIKILNYYLPSYCETVSVNGECYESAGCGDCAYRNSS